ncbi:MAG: glycosyltransferase family 2 protein [Planctomycetota bacterium]
MSQSLDTATPPLLSVIIPCYNEERTLEHIVARVLRVKVPMEIIIVDDASKDKSREKVQAIAAKEPCVKAFYHEKNQGKGAALATGFQHARGVYAIVQDADLEYDPQEFYRLLVPALAHGADVVFGSRFRGEGAKRVLYYWHSIANGWLTTLSNMTSNLNLSDMETCYKLFRREVIQSVKLKEKRFGFEPEVTAKVAKMGCCVYELGISYSGRTYDEGKKIGMKDAFRALYCILLYGLFTPRTKRPELPPLPERYQKLAEDLKAQTSEDLENLFVSALR